jgi:hypothetical protein
MAPAWRSGIFRADANAFRCLRERMTGPVRATWVRTITQRRAATIGSAIALALAGIGAITGSPGVTLAALKHATTSFTVTGVAGHDRVYIFRVTGHRSGVGQLVRRPAAIFRSTGPLTLTVSSNASPGVYVAVEVSPHGSITVSPPVGWHVAGFQQPVTLAATPVVSSPRVRLGQHTVRADTTGPGQLNGSTCGSLAFQNSPSGWIGTWSGCTQLANYVGATVWVIGAAPLPGGANPFDNPTSVLGFWWGTVPPVSGGNSPNVTVNIGFDNNVGAANNTPFVPDEWFDMQLSSTAVESPAGQLPEAPWAVALPLALAASLWAAMQLRHREA